MYTANHLKGVFQFKVRHLKRHKVFGSLLTEGRLEKYSSEVPLLHCTSYNMRQLDPYPHSVFLSLSHLLFPSFFLQLHFVAQERVTVQRYASVGRHDTFS